MTVRQSDLQIETCKLWAEGDACLKAGLLLKAEALFRVAAELGYPLAMNSLAVLIEDDIQPSPPAEAVYWLKRAAAAGSEMAAWNLAMRHRLAGARRWYIHWLRVAERLGETEATRALAVATTRDDVWWTLEGVPPPPFVKEPVVV